MEAIVLSAKQRWFKRKMGSDWDDVMQEARIRCIGHMDKPYYDAYFSRALTNAAINYLRHRTKVELVSITGREEKPIDASELSYEVNFEVNYDVRRFMMGRWTALERDVIFMFFTRQVPVRVAAAMLGRSRTRTHVWLMGVRRQFREEMK